MSKPLVQRAVRASSQPLGWRVLIPFTLVAALWGALGATAGYLHLTRGEADAYRAACGLLLLAAAVWQCFMVAGLARRGCAIELGTLERWLLVGAALSYGVCLVIGPGRETIWIFVTLICGCDTALVWLAARKGAVIRRPAWANSPRVQRAALLALYALGVALLVELAGQGWLRIAQSDRPLPLCQSEVANAPAPLTNEFLGANAQAGLFRVAIVGANGELAGAGGSSLAQLEGLVPGLKIADFSSSAGAMPFERKAVDEVMANRPDLVLTVISLGSELGQAAASRDPFDWHSLWTVRTLFGAASASRPAMLAADSPAEFMNAFAPQLAVCRTPMDDATRARWRESFSRLDRWVERCRRQNTAVALVVVPSQFQVNNVLCDALRRRHGYQESELDLELPQRRLAAFAEERKLPMLDLLPYLRGAQQPVYRRQDVRWNELGHDLAVHAIGGWLQSRYGTSISAANVK